MTPVPRVVTRWTDDELLGAYAAAWPRVVGGEPSRAALAILWGHASIECSRNGVRCYNYNVGNVRAGESEPHYLLPSAYEFALPGQVPAGATIIPIPAGSAPPSPAHVAYLLPAKAQRFRSFDSFHDGCAAKLALVLRRWPRALAALRTASSPSSALLYVDGLLARPAYLTGSGVAYANSIAELAAELMARRPDHAWPAPSDDPITEPDSPKGKSSQRTAAVRPSTPPPAHLPPQGATLRGNAWGHAYALTEAPPARDPLSVIRWLAVERSPRYRPSNVATYCNVYAHDAASAMGAYLPRVWWVDTAGTGQAVLGRTVAELSANALFRWLVTWGGTFGWARVGSLDAAQDGANAGRPVLICARRTDEGKPGHIGLVAPESDACRALRGQSNAVILPVQSMAGGTLLELGHGKGWWRGSEFAEWGAWVHRETPSLMSRIDGPATPLRAGEGEHTVATEDIEF